MNIILAMIRSGMLLAMFATLNVALIAWVWVNTHESITSAIRKAEIRQLLEIFPTNTHDNVLIDDRLEIPANAPLLELRKPGSAYFVRKKNDIEGVILPATARDGYSGDIQLLVGVRTNGSLAGIRVLSHRETPGLGDAIDLKKSDWVLGFEGKSLENPPKNEWAVRKDGGVFDQFTGATITPRAVVNATRRTLSYVALNRKTLFNQNFTDKKPVKKINQ